ncbi:MAG: hypothetical protein MI749_09545, partial [Desulfovibrionales bacterium]|nr:hypothetical protein [Desulfovibrionales bacterium]
NNQDLATLEMDSQRAPRVAAIFPKEIIPLAISGISNRKIIEANLDHGILNFLVGQPLIQAQDPTTTLHYLRTGKMPNE